jgi:hypothetical protein
VSSFSSGGDESALSRFKELSFSFNTLLSIFTISLKTKTVWDILDFADFSLTRSAFMMVLRISV